MESACSASSCTSVLLLVVLLLLNSLVIECFIVFILKECLIAIHCVDLCSIWVVRCRFFQSPFLASQTMSAEECQECPDGFLAGPTTCGSCPFASSERCLVRTYENGYLNFRAPLGVSFCKVETSPGCNNRLQRAPKERQTCKRFDIRRLQSHCSSSPLRRTEGSCHFAAQLQGLQSHCSLLPSQTGPNSQKQCRKTSPDDNA